MRRHVRRLFAQYDASAHVSIASLMKGGLIRASTPDGASRQRGGGIFSIADLLSGAMAFACDCRDARAPCGRNACQYDVRHPPWGDLKCKAKTTYE
jgi:hypothetical protein